MNNIVVMAAFFPALYVYDGFRALCCASKQKVSVCSDILRQNIYTNK